MINIMTTEHEQESLVPFKLNISGKISAQEAKEFYDRILALAGTVGELSTAQEVSILFNLPTIGKGYRKGRFNLEDNGSIPEHKEMTDVELEVSLFQLGNDIRARRRELGFSQAAVALDADISQSYLSQIELARQAPGGLRRPASEAIVGIARALGMEEQVVLDLAGYEVPQIQQNLSE